VSVFRGDVGRALGESGCPACRMLRAEERRFWFFFLYEGFQDPAADARLRDSAGFCRRHRGQLAQRRDVFAAASIALASVDGALGRLARRPSRFPGARRRVTPSGSGCPLCANLETLERSVLDAISALLADPAQADAYRRCDGLCFDHVGLALERGLDRDGVMLESAQAALAALRERLGELVRSFDYHSESAGHELAATPLEALRQLGGDPGRVR
jgi:hypothetical protein